MNLNERIEFYRALGFFEKNSNLNTEELKDFLMKKSEDSYFGELGEEMEELDIAVLSLDLEKVWFVEDCFVYGSLFENEQEMYISSVKKLSEISGGIFLPENISIRQSGFCSGRSERWILKFSERGKTEEIVFCGDLDVLVFSWIGRINELIQDRGMRICCIADSYGPAVFFFLEKASAEKLSKEVKPADFHSDSFWLDAGEYFFEKENYSEALSSYTKAYSLNQELWHAYSCAANCNDCLKRYNDKINICRNAVSLLSQKKEKDSNENWWLEFFSREIEKTESAVRGS